ncbi:hypothetical protein PPYR_09592 [Photinus pyralis]|uniref:ABC transmembrane type-1 domain-containing protein n=1 Tax=Photinus pyralis TaxID=7054 RepID=A0A5N4AMP2_PHOPY|nr:hypothetical protein PPYR_09592 [Photinus pyralis]
MEQELSGFRLNQTTNSTEYQKLEESHDNVMRLYSFVMLGTAIFTILRAYTFYTFSSKASTNIHNSVVDRILNTGMMFFDNNLSGSVLNRFSRDLGIIDEQMPNVLAKFPVHQISCPSLYVSFTNGCGSSFIDTSEALQANFSVLNDNLFVCDSFDSFFPDEGFNVSEQDF